MTRAAFSLTLAGSSFFLIGGAGASLIAIIAVGVPQAVLAALEGDSCAF
jgi:hypothetical protein